jgi:hypothetical protein
MVPAHCPFCSSPYPANEALAVMPVGRRLAFETSSDRVWLVCLKCARWALLPQAGRAEVSRDAAAAFTAARPLLSSGKVELAERADGTRLIRIGAAGREEVALWRFAGFGGFRPFWQGELRVTVGIASLLAIPIGLMGPIALAGPIGWLGLALTAGCVAQAVRMIRAENSLVFGVAGIEKDIVLGYRHVQGVRLIVDGTSACLLLPETRYLNPGDRNPLRICGERMRVLLLRLFVPLSPQSYREGELRDALELGDRLGSADAQLRRAADREPVIGFGRGASTVHRLERIALDIALQEAMESSDQALAGLWSETEALAGLVPTRRKGVG